jgi:hypothetical protein
LQPKTSNIFLEKSYHYLPGGLGSLTSYAQVPLHIADHPGARLRDIAVSLGITERRAHGIIT